MRNLQAVECRGIVSVVMSSHPVMGQNASNAVQILVGSGVGGTIGMAIAYANSDALIIVSSFFLPLFAIAAGIRWKRQVSALFCVLTYIAIVQFQASPSMGSSPINYWLGVFICVLSGIFFLLILFLVVFPRSATGKVRQPPFVM